MPILASPSINLTDEQNDAIHYLTTSKDQVRKMGGYGGTGKSTIVRELARRLPHCAVCTFTGKAAQVLRKKGVPASTIHSLIYTPTKDPDTGKVVFTLRPPWEFAAQTILVDEASMVNKRLDADLRSFGAPIVYIGDHGQLEPVGGEDFSLMAKPDITLEKIHRNAGEIAYFAQHLREGNNAKDWDAEKMLDGSEHELGKVEIVTANQLGDLAITEDDQLICAFNRTRCDLNSAVRQHLGNPQSTAGRTSPSTGHTVSRATRRRATSSSTQSWWSRGAANGAILAGVILRRAAQRIS